MKRVFIAGGLSFDSVIQLGELPEPRSHTAFSKGYFQTVGGTGAGKALNIARLGFDTIFHELIGEDESGEKVKKYFDNQPLKFIYDIDKSGTETHTNIMDDHGGRISIYTEYATFDPEIKIKDLEGNIAKSDYIVINIINYTRELITFAKKINKKVWIDIHDYDGENEYHKEYIEEADFLFMSSDQMSDSYRDFMKEQIKTGKEWVICTHGKEGATAVDKDGNWYEVPIIEAYEREDTNGAGDSFFSGVLYGYSKKYDLETSMKYGAIVAGLCVTSNELYFENISLEYIEQEYIKHFGV